MAATRRNAMLIEEAREKIRTTQLINRLQDHAVGEIEMSATQIKATEILLRKSVPDLQAITLSGDAENPLVVVAAAGQSLDQKFDRLLTGSTAETSTDTLGS